MKELSYQHINNNISYQQVKNDISSYYDKNINVNSDAEIMV